MFDINLLPMNLKNGRNRGMLPGMFVYTAPKRCDKTRKSDVLILLISTPEDTASDLYEEWASLLSAEYFGAGGSFTMGFTAAAAKFSKALGKLYKNVPAPDVCLHMAAVRDNTMLICHGGPVHTTAIFSNRVENYSDTTVSPITSDSCELRFFRADLHNEDLFLLCPWVPEGWTNDAILASIGESPINAVRYLLNRSDGNLQAAVIQIRNGRGEITVRSKMPIIAEVRPERPESVQQDRVEQVRTPEQPERPLYRTRKPAALPAEFLSKPQADPDPEPIPEEISEEPSVEEPEPVPEPDPLPNEEETPAESEIPVVRDRKRPEHVKVRPPKKPHNWKTFFAVLLCGVLVPLIVAGVLFFVYTGRSNSNLHRDYLEQAVISAQNAMNSSSPTETERQWLETLNSLDQALNYGTSPAARELKGLALTELDTLMGGIHIPYRFGTSAMLPAGIRLTHFASDDQFTYALDSGSGGVIRFTSGSSGMVRDTNFNCMPGTYPTKDGRGTVKVGAFRDFVLLPSGNAGNDLLAAMDGEGNIAYCSSFSGNTALVPERPTPAISDTTAIFFSDNRLFVLDAGNSALWVYGYDKSTGFYGEPSAFYGSYTPNLTEVTDFVVYKDYAFYLRNNSSLMNCDFTGFIPNCVGINEISSEDGSVVIDLTKHDIGELILNRSPDNSLYLMDRRLQSAINVSVKLNVVRTIAPDRETGEQPPLNRASAFGITGQDRMIWAYNNNIYIGNMP